MPEGEQGGALHRLGSLSKPLLTAICIAREVAPSVYASRVLWISLADLVYVSLCSLVVNEVNLSKLIIYSKVVPRATDVELFIQVAKTL